jgi:hypothetical protein
MDTCSATSGDEFAGRLGDPQWLMAEAFDDVPSAHLPRIVGDRLDALEGRRLAMRSSTAAVRQGNRVDEFTDNARLSIVVMTSAAESFVDSTLRFVRQSRYHVTFPGSCR